MHISIVATLYQSAPYVREFHAHATRAALDMAGDDYEIILVNDGSPDDSLAIAAELAGQDSHVTVVDLSRNFGHHKAIMTGLNYARGDYVFLLDSDLEEQPEWLADFHKTLTANDCDVVFGVQSRRKGGVFERLSGEIFYRMVNFLSDVRLPRNLVTARLMTARYVKALLLHREREINLSGLWAITGFRQMEMPVRKLAGSETTYTLAKKMSILINAVTSFSNRPLIMIFNVGLTISALAAVYIAYLLFNWAFLAKPASGWTSLIGSIWLLGGMIISFIGIIGIYIAKIFTEVKQRPNTVVRQIIGQQND